MASYRVEWAERTYYKAIVDTDIEPDEEGFEEAIQALALNQAEFVVNFGIENLRCFEEVEV